MRQFDTLKKNAQFVRVFKKAKSFHSPLLVLFYEKTEDKKVGFVASKKVGNAVHRNRGKRILREIFRNNERTLMIGTYVLVAKKELLEHNYHEVNDKFRLLLEKLLYTTKQVSKKTEAV